MVGDAHPTKQTTNQQPTTNNQQPTTNNKQLTTNKSKQEIISVWIEGASRSGKTTHLAEEFRYWDALNHCWNCTPQVGIERKTSA